MIFHQENSHWRSLPFTESAASVTARPSMLTTVESLAKAWAPSIVHRWLEPPSAAQRRKLTRTMMETPDAEDQRIHASPSCPGRDDRHPGTTGPGRFHRRQQRHPAYP